MVVSRGFGWLRGRVCPGTVGDCWAVVRWNETSVMNSGSSSLLEILAASNFGSYASVIFFFFIFSLSFIFSLIPVLLSTRQSQAVLCAFAIAGTRVPVIIAIFSGLESQSGGAGVRLSFRPPVHHNRLPTLLNPQKRLHSHHQNETACL